VVDAPVRGERPAVAHPPRRTRAGCAAADVRIARRRAPWSDRRFYLVLAGVALALGALSLLLPSTPSYDPWSWILWGREIVHGRLFITTTGTSWKPLPMIFTIPFALLGSAAADLWLVIARAGALAAVVLSGRMAWRLTRRIADADTDAPALSDGALSTVRTLAPALAAAVAVVALGFCVFGAFISSSALGYSEGLATALLLVAIERHLAARPRQAFLVGFLVACDRPEIWLFWVPYGLWLAWRDRRFAPVVITALVLQPVVWFVPVYLGSGHFGSSVTRAQNPRSSSLAYASSPFLSELWDAAWRTVPLRVKALAAALTVATAGVAIAAVRRGGRGAFATERMRALLITIALGLAGVVWFVLIALMTQLHFSGNDRYLVLGAALLDVCGAVGFGVLVLALARAGTAIASRTGRRAGRGLGGAAVALSLAVFLLAPDWIGGGTLISLPALHGELVYQARLRESLSREIAAAGGPRHALACGSVMTEGFQVPMVAYALGVRTARVDGPPPPTGAVGAAPNLVLQTRATRSSQLLPYMSTWPSVHYTVHGGDGPFHLYTHCLDGRS
jgi:hypothetical protein